MKKLLIPVFVLFLFACGSNDNTAPANDKPVIVDYMVCENAHETCAAECKKATDVAEQTKKNCTEACGKDPACKMECLGRLLEAYSTQVACAAGCDKTRRECMRVESEKGK